MHRRWVNPWLGALVLRLAPSISSPALSIPHWSPEPPSPVWPHLRLAKERGESRWHEAAPYPGLEHKESRQPQLSHHPRAWEGRPWVAPASPVPAGVQGA